MDPSEGEIRLGEPPKKTTKDNSYFHGYLFLYHLEGHGLFLVTNPAHTVSNVDEKMLLPVAWQHDIVVTYIYLQIP